ncbi:MAG: RNA polymerase sigma-70 factor [Runella sp.]
MPRDGNVLFEKVQRQNDYQAFEKLFKSYYRPVCNYAFKILHSPETAEEVASDIFLKIWRNRERIEIQSSFDSYLFRAVRNQCFDYLKSQPKMPDLDISEINHEQIESTPSPEQEMAYWQLYEKVEAAIEKLPTQCKLIFRMSRDEGLKYREIADKLGLSIKTVETQMGRALKSLRDELLSAQSSSEYHEFTENFLIWIVLIASLN